MRHVPRPRWSLRACALLSVLAAACVADPEPADTDGATDGPAACEPAAPPVLAGIEVELGDFPVEGASADGYRFDDAPCTVTAVDLSVASRVRTELECESEAGMTHAVAVEHRSTELGDPGWAAGDALWLTVELRVYSDLNDIPLWNVAMRSPQGEPRLLVVDSDFLPNESIAAPFEVTLDDDACPSEDDPEGTRGILSLTLDGVTTMVLDGHDGTLETPAGTFAVELPRALSGDYGERSLYLDLLVMKVQ